MPISRARVFAGAAGLAGIVGVIGGTLTGSALAQERPESILPPGFGEPAQSAPTPTPTARPNAPQNEATPSSVPAAAATPPGDAVATATPTPGATVDPATLAEYELPEFARHPLSRVGAAGAMQERRAAKP